MRLAERNQAGQRASTFQILRFSPSGRTSFSSAITLAFLPGLHPLKLQVKLQASKR